MSFFPISTRWSEQNEHVLNASHSSLKFVCQVLVFKVDFAAVFWSFLFVCNLAFSSMCILSGFSYFKHNTNLLNTFLYFLVQNIRFHHSYFVSFYSHNITFSKSEKASPFCNRIMRLKINDLFAKSLNECVLFMLIDHLTCTCISDWGLLLLVIIIYAVIYTPAPNIQGFGK